MKETNNQLDFSLKEVLKFILRWRWHVLVITLVSGVLAVVFSGPKFITPKFESTVILYPGTNNSISNAILSDNTVRDKDALEFGEESEAEYALQILGSASLMGSVVQHFNLMEHYGIDPSESMPQTKLDRQIKKNFSFRRTELLSIELKVRDKNPQLAADMANYIASMLDTTKTMIQRQVAYKSFEIIQKEYEAKQKEVEMLQQAINDLTAGRPVSDDLVSNPFSRKNKKAARTDALEQSGNMGGKAGNLGTLLTLTESLSLQVEQLNELKKKYERAKVDVEEFIPHYFVVSPAAKAEQKIYPIRSLLVLMVMGATFVFVVLFLIVSERVSVAYKALKQDEHQALA